MPNKLLAGGTLDSAAPTLALADLPASYRELVAEAQTDLQPQQGAFDMFVDLPPDAPAQPPTLMLAESGQARKPASAQRALGVCKIVQNFPGFSEELRRAVIVFPASAANYLFDYEKLNIDERNAKVTLLQSPKNGQLEDEGSGFYTYRPNPSFHGQDKIQALVELGAYRVKVTYFIKVTMDRNVGDDADSIEKYCGQKGDFWRISLPEATLDPTSLQSLSAAAGLDHR